MEQPRIPSSHSTFLPCLAQSRILRISGLGSSHCKREAGPLLGAIVGGSLGMDSMERSCGGLQKDLVPYIFKFWLRINEA